jgi:hypothetical protein
MLIANIRAAGYGGFKVDVPGAKEFRLVAVGDYEKLRWFVQVPRYQRVGNCFYRGVSR